MYLYNNPCDLIKYMKICNNDNLYLNLTNGYYLAININKKIKNKYVIIKLKHVEIETNAILMKFCVGGREEGYINLINEEMIYIIIENIYSMFTIFQTTITDISEGRK